jgi:hypothetical protein|nr:MAG TPA: tail tape measure [Caudoviricetes sp.]
MSVLNTFALVFETEGDELTLKKVQQIDAAGKKLEQTNKKTGKSSEKAGQQAKTSAQQFAAFKGAIAGAIAPALALGTVLSRTLNFAAQGEQLLFMSKSANMAANEFQKLAIASERFGGSREGAAGMMAGLASQLQALKFGQSAPLQDAAMMYGLNLQGKNGNLAEGNELLRNVAQTMERLDTSAQLDLGRRIGLDEATIRILQQGVAAFDAELARAEKRRVFTDEDLKRAQELQKSWRDMQQSMQGLWAEIARFVLPIVQQFIDSASAGFEYLRQHAEAVKAGLVVISAIMAGIAVASLAAFAPWLGTAAIIAAIAAAVVLLYEDFKVFAKGGESALAPFWKKLVDFGLFWQDLPDWVKKVTSAIIGLINPLETVKNAFSFISAAMSKVGGFAGWLRGSRYNADLDYMVKANAALRAADANPMAGVQAGSISNTTNRNDNSTTNSYQLTVNGSSNPVRDGAILLDQARGEGFYNLASGQEG